MENKTQTFNCGISGYVKPGFEPVISVLERLYKMEQDKRGQLCVYVGEEIVVDVIMNNLEPAGSGGRT